MLLYILSDIKFDFAKQFKGQVHIVFRFFNLISLLVFTTAGTLTNTIANVVTIPKPYNHLAGS